MTITDLVTFHDYGNWANQRVFEALLRLAPGHYTKSMAGGHGSIRNTLVHVLSAEAGWLDRCGGPKRGPRLNPDDYPTVESLIEAWHRIEVQEREFLSSLKDEDVLRSVEYLNDRGEKRSMPLGELMLHSVNHGVHHRGQVALMLRELGHEPGYFDMVIYFAEKRGVSAW